MNHAYTFPARDLCGMDQIDIFLATSDSYKSFDSNISFTLYSCDTVYSVQNPVSHSCDTAITPTYILTHDS